MHTCVNIKSFKQWQRILKEGKSDPSRISGNFNCESELLMSIEGSPTTVDEEFSCHHNFLTSLIGGPSFVGGSYYCSKNKIQTLVGGPIFVRNIFACNDNLLETIDYAPVAKKYSFGKNQITNLKDIHKIIPNAQFINFEGNPITSNILGLLLIKQLIDVQHAHPAFKIINNHLKGDKDILLCQEELIEAGFKDFARF